MLLLRYVLLLAGKQLDASTVDVRGGGEVFRRMERYSV